MVTSNMNSRLIKHILRCYFRLSENSKLIRGLITENLPSLFKDKKFIMCLEESSRKWLQSLFKTLSVQERDITNVINTSKNDSFVDRNSIYVQTLNHFKQNSNSKKIKIEFNNMNYQINQNNYSIPHSKQEITNNDYLFNEFAQPNFKSSVNTVNYIPNNNFNMNSYMNGNGINLNHMINSNEKTFKITNSVYYPKTQEKFLSRKGINI